MKIIDLRMTYVNFIIIKKSFDGRCASESIITGLLLKALDRWASFVWISFVTPELKID